MDEEEAGSKYAYLLQPIKDLEKNFAVDIVGLLEEYTKKLAQVAAEEADKIENAHRFNFAEAAMLIHGTANIYSRKVDLIHNQAMNFFECLKTTKEKKKKGNGYDDDDEGIGDDNDENADPFVATPVDPCVLQNFSRLKPANLVTLICKNPNLPVPSISITPMSLMPLADYEKCNVPMYNPKNHKEVVGKKDDFKINTGYMSKCGALLLDLQNERLVDIFVEKDTLLDDDDDSGRASPDDDPAVDVQLPELPSTQDIPNSQQFDPRRSSNMMEIGRATGPSLGNTLIGRPSSVNLFPDPRPSEPLAALKEADFSSDMCCGFDDDDLPQYPAAKPMKKEPWEFDPDTEFDPVIDNLEDPFAEVQWKHKPFKPGRNCMNINAILGRRKKEDEKKDPKERVMETIEFVNDQIYCKGKKQKKKRELGLGTQYKWEVDAILPYISAQQKLREKRRRELGAQKKIEERAALRRSGRQVPEIIDDDDDNDFGGGGFDDDVPEDAGRDKFMIAESVQRGLMANVDDGELAADLNFPEVYIDPPPRPGFPTQVRHEEGIHENMTIEEIISYYRKKYWEQTAEAMSKLAARVQEWDEKMQPLLEEEETRNAYDIHQYGTLLLDHFGKVSDVKSLPQLLAGKKRYEISRYFLSSLMLTNDRNIDIINEQQTGPDPLKMMTLRLLSRDRRHEVLNEKGAL